MGAAGVSEVSDFCLGGVGEYALRDGFEFGVEAWLLWFCGRGAVL